MNGQTVLELMIVHGNIINWPAYLKTSLMDKLFGLVSVSALVNVQ